MEAVSLLGILGMCSYRDVRYQSLRTGTLLLSAVVGIWMHLLFARIGLLDMAGGMSVGAFLYLIAYLSGEKIGKGDALLVTVCGIFLGFWETILLLWIAFLLAGIFGFIMMKFRHVGRDHQIPFVPFLLVGYVFCLMMWGGRIA